MPTNPISYVRLIDDESLEIIDTYKLAANEGVASLLSCKFNADGPEYYVAGVAEVLVDEDEPSVGRILVFQVVSKKLQLVTSLKVRGAVCALAPFRGGLLAGVNSTLLYLTWSLNADEYQLSIACGFHGHVMLLFIRAHGDFILTGDLTEALSLFHYKETNFQKQLELLATDDSPEWLTACEMLDVDTYLGSHSTYNLFMSQVGAPEERW